MVSKKTIFSHSSTKSTWDPAYGRCGTQSQGLLPITWKPFKSFEVDPVDRTVELGEPFTINGWTSFTFDGRQDTYNDFHWHWYHFTGTDYDAKRRKSGIYLIQGDNKGWD